MAPHLQSQSQKEKLLKAGFEGFAMLEAGDGLRTRTSPPPPSPPSRQFHPCNYQYYPQPSQVITAREPVMDSIQVARKYGGTVTMDRWAF
ncbi:hypothetical protein ACOSP7_007265 [Xanthoceras sorbifolium]